MLGFFVGYALFAVLCGVAIILHLSPYSSRRLKYSLLLVAVSLLWGGKMLGNFISLDAYWNRYAGWYVSFVFLAGPVYLIGIQLAARRFVLSEERADSTFPSPRVRRLFARLRWQAAGFIAATIFLPMLYPLSFEYIVWYPMVAYLTVRYVVGASLERHPIVYLRSFSQPNAPAAFRIVSAAASRHGVVTGLVNDRQPASEVSRLAPVSDFGRFYRVPDEVWRQWVSDVLKRCSAVVVDVTVGTENVLWELDEASRIVTSERVVVLKHQQSDAVIPAGYQLCDTFVPAEYQVIEYGHKDSEEAPRFLLEDRLAQMAAKFGPADVRPAPGMLSRLPQVVVFLSSMKCFALGVVGFFVFLFTAYHLLGHTSLDSNDWSRPPGGSATYMDEKTEREIRRMQHDLEEIIKLQNREALERERQRLERERRQ